MNEESFDRPDQSHVDHAARTVRAARRDDHGNRPSVGDDGRGNRRASGADARLPRQHPPLRSAAPPLAGRRPVVRFDFLGWGRSDKPEEYPYTATNQVGDLAAVIAAISGHLDASQLTLVAHDASGPPAIDWALANPGRVATLVLLNTYYHWIPSLRRPPAIALYSTPLIRTAARALVRRRPELDRLLYTWQVGRFIQDPEIRKTLVPRLYEQFLPARL